MHLRNTNHGEEREEYLSTGSAPPLVKDISFAFNSSNLPGSMSGYIRVPITESRVSSKKSVERRAELAGSQV